MGKAVVNDDAHDTGLQDEVSHLILDYTLYNTTELMLNLANCAPDFRTDDIITQMQGQLDLVQGELGGLNLYTLTTESLLSTARAPPVEQA